MRVWHVPYDDPDDCNCLEWFATKKEAEKWRKERIAQADDPECHGVGSVQAVDIPTDRAGLVDWLNTRLATDNG